MNALPWGTAKSKVGLSGGRGGVLAQEAARQDRGDFGGAFGGGELVGWGEGKGLHAVSSDCGREPDTIVIGDLTLDHPDISSV